MITCANCNAEPKVSPLKVYILAGQSNMTGMAGTNTFEHIKMFPDTAKEFADMFNKNGSPVVLNDVYVSCWPKGDYTLKGKIKLPGGPEGAPPAKNYEEFRARYMTQEEAEIIKKGVSNQGFHYLGSAKIMAGIGKGFAETMIELQEKD